MSKNYHDCYTALFERAYMLFGNEKQQAIAKKTGLPQGIISKIRSCYEYPNETYQPQAETVYKIAKAYNVSTDYLLGLTDVKTTDKATAEMCKGLNLSEDAIQLLITGTTPTLAKLIERNFPNTDESITRDSSKAVANNIGLVFNRLVAEYVKEYTYLHEHIDEIFEPKPLLSLLQDFYARLDSKDFTMFDGGTFVDLQGEAVITAETESGFITSVSFAAKDIFLTAAINDILARLNKIKTENK